MCFLIGLLVKSADYASKVDIYTTRWFSNMESTPQSTIFYNTIFIKIELNTIKSFSIKEIKEQFDVPNVMMSAAFLIKDWLGYCRNNKQSFLHTSTKSD